jgi:antitoxin component YwqK of YwqJK toxin-antitoxin module
MKGVISCVTYSELYFSLFQETNGFKSLFIPSRSFLILFIYFSLLVSKGIRQDISIQENQLLRKNNLVYQVGSSIPFTGQSIVSEYSSGRKQQIFRYKDGELYRSVWYALNGEVRLTENYRDGILHGEWVEYYAGNRLKEKGHFNKGKKDGLWEDIIRFTKKRKNYFEKRGF